MKARITERDNGYRQFIRTLAANKKLGITLGVHQEDGGAMHDGFTLAQIAERIEFGLGIEARPAITAWMAERGPAAIKEMNAFYGAALKAKKNPAQALDALAQKFLSEIQARIRAGIAPPKKSGEGIVWIDTGVLVASMRGKVVAL